jgi:hypothetical protein
LNLIYQVKVGETPAFYEPCIASVARYCKRYGIDHMVQTEPILKVRPVKSHRSVNALRLGYLPIMEKSNAFGFLAQYEKVAIVDADIFIKASAPNLFDELTGDFAAVLERDMPLTEKYREKIRKYSEGQYRSLTDVDWQWDCGAAFYNMGLMLFGQGVVPHLGGAPAEFVRRPEFERFVNGEGHWRWSTDQTLLNYWVKKSGMRTQSLDWRWNALYGGIRDDALHEARFVHFFLSAKLPRGGAEIPSLLERM